MNPPLGWRSLPLTAKKEGIVIKEICWLMMKTYSENLVLFTYAHRVKDHHLHHHSTFLFLLARSLALPSKKSLGEGRRAFCPFVWKCLLFQIQMSSENANRRTMLWCMNTLGQPIRGWSLESLFKGYPYSRLSMLSWSSRTLSSVDPPLLPHHGCHQE